MSIGGVIMQQFFVPSCDIVFIAHNGKKNFHCSLPGLIRFFLNAKKVPLIPPDFIVIWTKQLLSLLEGEYSFLFRSAERILVGDSFI
jgi:hypothetical protein